MYAADEDPWGYRDRWYEIRKRSLTLAALPRPRYRSAFEPGCSIGITSAELAPRCDALLCFDINADAVKSATANLVAMPHASVRQARIPDDWPDGMFDLIVLSETLYYLDATERAQAMERVQHSLEDDGTVLACHWLHPIPESNVSVDAMHDAIGACGGLTHAVHHREQDFLLDVWTRDARSVAQREGLA